MNNKLLKQHNAITRARYDMSATEKNIIYMLLAQLSDEDSIKHIYTIRIKELEKSMCKELSYSHLKDTTKKLIKRVYTITDISEDKPLHIALLTAVRYKKGGGNIELELSKKIRPYFFHIKKNFTTFQLHMALKLKSKFSKRLYEILSQYKDTGILYITVEELKLCLGLIDDQTGEEQYKNFYDFEKFVILVAQQELEKSTDLSFTYTKKTFGKKVTELVFMVNYKSKKSTKKISEGTLEEPLKTRLIKDHEMAEWQAERIMQLVEGDKDKIEFLTKKLYAIKGLKRDHKIQSIGGYTAKILHLKWPELELIDNSKNQKKQPRN